MARVHFNLGGAWHTGEIRVFRDGAWRVLGGINKDGTWHAHVTLAAATGAYLQSSGFYSAAITWYSSGESSDGNANWADPVGSASGLFIKFVRADGQIPEGDAFDQWLPMTSNRVLQLVGDGYSQSLASGDYFVATAPSDGAVIGGGGWRLNASGGIEV